MVRIPQVRDIEKAVELYYTRLDLSNADIKALFGAMGSQKVAELKKLAEDVRREKNAARWSPLRVPTSCAFEAWGLDIEDLEKRLARMRRLNMAKERKEK